eukprot:gene8148-10124_t
MSVWSQAFAKANEGLEAIISEETRNFQSKLTRAQHLLRELSEEENKIQAFRQKFPNLIISMDA